MTTRASEFAQQLEQAIAYFEASQARDNENKALIKTILDENARILHKIDAVQSQLRFLYSRYDYLFSEVKKLKERECKE